MLGILRSCGITVLTKPGRIDWGDCFTSDFSISMFDVDNHEETPQVWRSLVPQFGSWNSWYSAQCFGSLRGNLEYNHNGD
ncbi:hypothetical protein Tsubulata_014216 [Turnera subulata]|uniref:Uncharacterized protein n=1 Tax=Turnera subulata TaxID=218843 RepID=A0A9Q0J9E7_9ROSI|nr:hypothetical protein Tsubulata_014216 [Turnera subulata]